MDKYYLREQGADMGILTAANWASVVDSNRDVFNTKGHKYLPLGTKSIRDLHIGVTGLNQKCLMFKTSKALLEEKTFPDTEGLEVGLDFGFGEAELGVVLKLKNDDFIEVFVTLSNDLVNAMQALKDDKQFIDTFFGRLGIWKLFLDKSGEKGLGPERRRGLFGELHLLKELVIPAIGTDSIKFWTGPSGAMHDFEFGKFAVECKTMASNKSQKVSISNERQLEDAGYDDLFLACVAITVRRNATPSLVTIVKEIESLLERDPLNLVNFRNNLLRCGYSSVHDEIYQREGYHVDEIHAFKVRDGFPRLLASDLEPGVGGLHYTVDLSACTSFVHDYDDVKKRLSSL